MEGRHPPKKGFHATAAAPGPGRTASTRKAVDWSPHSGGRGIRRAGCIALRRCETPNMEGFTMPTSSRNKHSKLDHPEIVTFLRRCGTARLKATDKRHYSLQKVADRIAKRFRVRVHKSTVHRFLKDIGVNFAWGKTK
jgi:hypothetical protein